MTSWVSRLRRWLAPLSQITAAGDRNSGAADFVCAAGLIQAALWAAKVTWCLRNHDNVLGGHFKHGGGGLGPAGSAPSLGSSKYVWSGTPTPLLDSPEVIRLRKISPCREIDHEKHGEKSVCMRVCYKLELIESEILSGLKWDPPASFTLRLRRRAANMTEFIKCVIKELKLSVAARPCTPFQVC